MKLKQLGIALDQLLNVICAGYADETLSARAHRNRDKNKRWRFFQKLFNKIFFWQNDHCRGAYNAEIIRQHYPIYYREREEKNAVYDQRKKR